MKVKQSLSNDTHEALDHYLFHADLVTVLRIADAVCNSSTLRHALLNSVMFDDTATLEELVTLGEVLRKLNKEIK